MAQSSKLKKLQKIKLIDGRSITITDRLGEGGQGIVYKVRLDGTNEEKALKWYFFDKLYHPTDFYQNLKKNIDHGSPSPTFIWPEGLTEMVNGTFGYIMPLIPRGYYEFSKYLIAKRVNFANLPALVSAALNLVEAIMVLHREGYNYQDLNDGNYLVDPKTGHLLICDNDNVMGHGGVSGIRGKPRYMAPEVVRGEKTPNVLTDRHSLAVNLHLLLIGGHPLEGAKTNVPVLTQDFDMKFFGTEPVYTFDPFDACNRPRTGLHTDSIKNWPCYPGYIQNAFQKSFSQECLLRGEGRLLEQAWLHLLTQLKSSIVKCPHCGQEMFLEPQTESKCPDCQHTTRPPGYLKFLKRRTNLEISVPIFTGVKLYESQVNEVSEDFRTEGAVIISKQTKIGLMNNSNYTWETTSETNIRRTKPRGEVVLLSPGTKIDFRNGNIAEVKSN